VLIVDDDPDVVALLETVLGQEGIDTTVAEDGLEGLVKRELTHPDLAIVDIMMPAVDGLRMLEQLLEEGGGQLPVRVIVLTGSIDGAERARRLIGRDNVFTKPFEPELLIARIRELTG